MIGIQFNGAPLVIPDFGILREIGKTQGYEDFKSVFWEYGHGFSTPAQGVMLILGRDIAQMDSTDYGDLLFFDEDYSGLQADPSAPAGMKSLCTFACVRCTRRELVVPSGDPDDSLWMIWLEDVRGQIPGSATTGVWNMRKGLSWDVAVVGDTEYSYAQVFALILATARYGASIVPSITRLTNITGALTLKPRNVNAVAANPPVILDNLVSDLCGAAVFAYDGATVYITAPGEVSIVGEASVADFLAFYNVKMKIRTGFRSTQKSAHTVPVKVLGVFPWSAVPEDPRYLYYEDLESVSGKPAWASGTHEVLALLPHITVPYASDYTADPDNKADLQASLNEWSLAYYNQFKCDPFSFRLLGFAYFPPSAEWTKLRYQVTSGGPETLLEYTHHFPQKISPAYLNKITQSTGTGDLYHRGIYHPSGWVDHEVVGGEGTHVTPFVIDDPDFPDNPPSVGSHPDEDTWDRDAPPAATDGVQVWVCTGYSTDYLGKPESPFYYRLFLFDSRGSLVSISAETPDT
jgi:hypothetical protein